MRIGIDVGGTSTDAVLVDGDEVCATAKTATTFDVTHGIIVALELLRAAPRADPSAVDAVDAVVVGTTHFTNALTEAANLTPTAVVRLGGPATQAIPPLACWPDRLVRAIRGQGFICSGGHEFDGQPLAAVDDNELRAVATDIAAAGIRSVAISAVFSVPYRESERHAAALLTRELPGLRVSLSHEIGRPGLLGRENATAVNACLTGLADTVADALADACAATGIDAPLFLTQNDGTVMDVEYARRYPVATFASGPANSMRGAAFLSGVSDALVVDAGGTTTDVGMLDGGFPLPAARDVEVAGVRTNCRMPHVASAPVGGGSEVVDRGSRVEVGPRSVGSEIRRRSRIFGGDTLTATDLAVAAGLIPLGDPRHVAGLAPDMVGRGLDVMASHVQGAVRQASAAAPARPVVLVGGAASLLGNRLAGVEGVSLPVHHAVANAVGAAVAPAGGEVDRIFAAGVEDRERVLTQARTEAVERAGGVGARPGTIHIVDVAETPVTYLSRSATRVRVRALGEPATRRPPARPDG